MVSFPHARFWACINCKNPERSCGPNAFLGLSLLSQTRAIRTWGNARVMRQDTPRARVGRVQLVEPADADRAAPRHSSALGRVLAHDVPAHRSHVDPFAD